jgi:hypothetical protein
MRWPGLQEIELGSVDIGLRSPEKGLDVVELGDLDLDMPCARDPES